MTGGSRAAVCRRFLSASSPDLVAMNLQASCSALQAKSSLTSQGMDTVLQGEDLKPHWRIDVSPAPVASTSSGVRFAFYGRCLTEDRQDPIASRAWQLHLAQLPTDATSAAARRTAISWSTLDITQILLALRKALGPTGWLRTQPRPRSCARSSVTILQVRVWGGSRISSTPSRCHGPRRPIPSETATVMPWDGASRRSARF